MAPVVGPFLVGVILASIIGGLLYVVSARSALWLAAVALVITGLLYLFFALLAGRADALPVETIGAVITVVTAIVGVMRRSPGILVIGWTFHPFWDVALHTRGLGGYAPHGYVPFCVGFDFTVAALIMLVAARNDSPHRIPISLSIFTISA